MDDLSPAEGKAVLPKPTYKESYPEIDRVFSKRRSSWTYLSMMEWADVKQELLLRAYKKWHLYDPNQGPLENWLNTLATNELFNLRRNLLLRTARPCIGGGKANGKRCEFNKGGDSCTYTPSQTQCGECPVYAKWEKEKQAQHHAKNQVSLEHHAQEAHSKPDESANIADIREWLYQEMLNELTPWEGRVFRLTIIKELTPAQAVQALSVVVAKRKRPPAANEGYTYSAILQYNRLFKGMMRQILLRGGYIGEEHMDPNRNRHRTLSHG